MKKQGKIKAKVVEGLALPRDLMLGECVIQIFGNSLVFIENYSGIIEYSLEKIKIKTNRGNIEIEGRALVISYYAQDEMKIDGCIKRISLCY